MRSILWRAAVTGNSPRDAAPLLAVPSLLRGQTRVVSIADYAPPKRDNPSAKTSRRRASLTLNQVTSKSQTVTFVETRPPASLCGGALQCVAPSPKHANLCARSSTMAKDVEETTTSASAGRNGCASIRHALPAGKAVKTADANGPRWDLQRALWESVWVDSAHPRPPRDVVRRQPAIPK